MLVDAMGRWEPTAIDDAVSPWLLMRREMCSAVDSELGGVIESVPPAPLATVANAATTTVMTLV